MIDYYYEFEPGSQLFGEPVRFAIQRGWHPENHDYDQRVLRSVCYQNSIREWIENANGLTLVREYGQDVHVKCDNQLMTWIKLQAREL